MPDITMKRERTGRWIKMRPSRDRSNGPGASSHMLSSVDCITTTSESEFSVHTGHRHRCLLGNIVRDHATILPDDATPKPDGIFGKDTKGIILFRRLRWCSTCVIVGSIPAVDL